MARIVGGETEDDLERYVSNGTCPFRSYKDYFNSLHTQSVLREEEGIPQQEMIQNIVSTTEKLKGDISQPILQRLQLARQLESLSKLRDQQILNTANWLVDRGMVSLRMTTWREIIRVSWIVHRYPVLGQVQLIWLEAKIVLPAVQDLFDKKVE